MPRTFFRFSLAIVVCGQLNARRPLIAFEELYKASQEPTEKVNAGDGKSKPSPLGAPCYFNRDCPINEFCLKTDKSAFNTGVCTVLPEYSEESQLNHNSDLRYLVNRPIPRRSRSLQRLLEKYRFVGGKSSSVILPGVMSTRSNIQDDTTTSSFKLDATGKLESHHHSQGSNYKICVANSSQGYKVAMDTNYPGKVAPEPGSSQSRQQTRATPSTVGNSPGATSLVVQVDEGDMAVGPRRANMTAVVKDGVTTLLKK
ncbi:uncharacterized protein LOC135399691 [Ornithodoros turicata]|uniref:uncharacterized protein LOC135399691 n=1 Tax=Ornithodoros turicata TaxID=34597 RepID=UPI00313975DD